MKILKAIFFVAIVVLIANSALETIGWHIHPLAVGLGLLIAIFGMPVVIFTQHKSRLSSNWKCQSKVAKGLICSAMNGLGTESCIRCNAPRPK